MMKRIIPEVGDDAASGNPAHASAPARHLRRIGRAVVDVVLPPRCLACGVAVDEPDALCAICWKAMHFFAAPWCAVCGLPFAHPIGEGAVCGACAAQQAALGPGARGAAL